MKKEEEIKIWMETMRNVSKRELLEKAAPELYEALSVLCDACNKYNIEALVPEYEKAMDALAKARGENVE